MNLVKMGIRCCFDASLHIGNQCAAFEMYRTSLVYPDNSSPSPFIPHAVEALWRIATLPTLTHLLGSSRTPFECGTDFQEISVAFKAANPQSPYLLVPGCAVFNKARDRLYERRSMVISLATQAVSKYFNRDEFTKAKDPAAAIANYAVYALQPDGPMLYLVPAPMNTKQGQPRYTAPEGFCESDFFIDAFSPFVKKTVGSKKDYGYLFGAVGMTAAALEKVFTMFLSGTFVRNDDAFSRDNVGDIVDWHKQANCQKRDVLEGKRERERNSEVSKTRRRGGASIGPDESQVKVNKMSKPRTVHEIEAALQRAWIGAASSANSRGKNHKVGGSRVILRQWSYRRKSGIDKRSIRNAREVLLSPSESASPHTSPRKIRQGRLLIQQGESTVLGASGSYALAALRLGGGGVGKPRPR
ncbi:hypothetical protein B0H19DRAFT_1239222 [Mycena capillaripes]|nr:hypothetical protein B0H19DRAFT_1239222 [Mycena capillaripes]